MRVKIYETLINTSKTFPSNSTKRAERLAAFFSYRQG